MRESEYKFYGRFKSRCQSVHCIRVENALDSGFPDTVLIHKGHQIMAEFKAEYKGGHVYMRNTQMSFSTRLLQYGVDVPIITGTLEGGMFIIPFSKFLEMECDAYKDQYKRFNTKSFIGVFDYIPQRSNWDATVVPVLFNR